MAMYLNAFLYFKTLRVAEIGTDRFYARPDALALLKRKRFLCRFFNLYLYIKKHDRVPPRSCFLYHYAVTQASSAGFLRHSCSFFVSALPIIPFSAATSVSAV